MPTKREREYYRMGFMDAIKESRYVESEKIIRERDPGGRTLTYRDVGQPKRKRKLSAWNKYVKANSKKPRFRYRNGKLNLKKMAVAFRKQRKRGGKR